MEHQKSLRPRDEISITWLRNLPDEKAREEFKKLLGLSNGPVIRRLLEIIKERQAQVQEATLNNDNYDSPSWAYVQADNVGYQRALKFVESLLKGIVK